MQQRPLTEPTSWRFYAAIHGIDPALWQQLGYLSSSESKPSAQVRGKFWAQCQHGSWYFLPWHRGYLLAFEAVVRDAIIGLGGPADWTLPYWNYFKAGQAALPTAFASRDWPDADGDNPLWVKARYGPRNDPADVFVDVNDVNLDAMNEPEFSGTAGGGSRGFGGIDTGFMHGGPQHGQLEAQPHDQVHGDVGGGTQQDPGVMSDPDTAGLDPIFWLHHANIDRLWEVWQRASGHLDPDSPKWLGGPAATGERAFVMPMPGGATKTYTPQDVDDLSALDYGYDDYTADGSATPAPAAALALRMERLGATTSAPKGGPVAGSDVELIGANDGTVQVAGGTATTTVTLDEAPRAKVEQSLAQVAASTSPRPPDRVFLNLENVRSRLDSATLRIYVGPPGEHPDQAAASVTLFGAKRASDPDGEHGGSGLSYSLDITDVIDRLHADNGFDQDHLEVQIEPRQPLPPDSGVSIGRVSIYRQGG
jgi:tyrosinase